MAVFGGSYSVIPESEIAKNIWKEEMNITITDYGVRGAGFSTLSSEYHIPSQIDVACAEENPLYDVYVLWASTNDYRKCNDKAGEVFDYSVSDGYSIASLATQCGGINYSIAKIREKAPEAKILFFSSTPIFQSEKDYSVDYTGDDGFAHFVALQRQCCEQQGVPFLDQFYDSPLTVDNWRLYFQEDVLHLNEAGYRLLAVKQKEFIEKEIVNMYSSSN